MNDELKNDLDYANGHAGRGERRRVEREANADPIRAADLARLHQDMRRFREATQSPIDPASLDRIVDQARMAAGSTSGFRAAPALFGVALVGAISLGVGWRWLSGWEDTAPAGPSASVRTRVSLIRADGAIRIYLTLPERAPQEAAS